MTASALGNPPGDSTEAIRPTRRHPEVGLIVATDRQGVIGLGGGLPWRLPRDLKRFRSLTWGHPLIMGRKTFDSIGRLLPGRTSIVLSRSNAWNAPEGVLKARDLDDAHAQAATLDPNGPIWIIGGGEIYRQAIERDLVDRVELTRVEHLFQGDTFFPLDWLDSWPILADRSFPADDRDPWPTRHLTLIRPNSGVTSLPQWRSSMERPA